MAKNPINFTEEIRVRLRPYAKLNDPLKASEAAFVQECVLAIIDLIETKPGERKVPSLVKRVCAVMENMELPENSVNSEAARDQRVADKIRADVQSAQPPKGNGAAGSKPRNSAKRGQSPQDSDRQRSPKEKD